MQRREHMKSEEAKAILKAYRPGGEDAADPLFAAALEQANKDPALARWLAEQRSFDAAFISAVKSIAVPRELKASLLTEPKVIPLPLWRGWPVRLAAAAVLVSLVALSVFWLKRTSTDFSDYRTEIVEASWDKSPHLDHNTATLREAQQWLDQQRAHGDFTLPAGLGEFQAYGCRVLEWRGQKVSFVCLLDGMKHLHLFVIDSQAVRNLPPPSLPDFENCAGWKTISWSQGDKLYVLTGMNYLSFIKKYRKHGQWMIAG
jgi:hypothetical protein